MIKERHHFYDGVEKNYLLGINAAEYGRAKIKKIVICHPLGS